MNKAIENLQTAMQFAINHRPAAGGFPFLAEVLRQAGVTHNLWSLPSCQSIYLTKLGSVVMQMPSLISEMTAIPEFDREALIRALRADQAGKTTFPEFIKASWLAGVVSYDVDLEVRKVSYYGVRGECYVEEYQAVSVKFNRSEDS